MYPTDASGEFSIVCLICSKTVSRDPCDHWVAVSCDSTESGVFDRIEAGTGGGGVGRFAWAGTGGGGLRFC